MLSAMELRHLRYFVAVAEAENVSRAALRLHVSQPALSRQIRDLEGELGFSLFERGARSLRMTDAGRTFLSEARIVLDRAAEAVRAAHAVAKGLRGELHVGYAPTPTARLIPPALRLFAAAQPGVRVKLHDLSTEEMLAALRQRTLHLAFLVRPTRAMLRTLSFTPLLRDPVRLAMARFHPFARMRAVPLARLKSEALLVFSRREFPEYHVFLDDLFRRLGSTPRIVEEHESGASLVAGIEAGTGIALSTQSLMCSIGSRLKLVRLAPEPEPLVVGAAWSKSGITAPAGQFLKGAMSVAADL